MQNLYISYLIYVTLIVLYAVCYRNIWKEKRKYSDR